MTKRNYRPDRARTPGRGPGPGPATGSRRMIYETVITLIKQIFFTLNSFRYFGGEASSRGGID